jgi:exportin-2 (importin alpha re-exporter)
VSSLSETDYNVNIGILQTSHSIFRQWRAHVRSDALFTEINLVFSKFMTPFLQLFRQTASALLNPSSNPALSSHANLPLLGESTAILIEIYYDFTCHDLPPALEDTHNEFFSVEGWFPSFIAWHSEALRGDVSVSLTFGILNSQTIAGRLNTINQFANKNRNI